MMEVAVKLASAIDVKVQAPSETLQKALGLWTIASAAVDRFTKFMETMPEAVVTAASPIQVLHDKCTEVLNQNTRNLWTCDGR